MRSKFPGYYKPTEIEFQELWKNAIFVLDTNVLLDLFRYSEDTVGILIETITELKNRIWIPYRVSLEYHRNLNAVIGSQINSYKKTIETLEEFKKQLDEKRSHPFLEKNLHTEIQNFCTKFDSELNKKRDNVELLITENPVKERISELLDDKVGDDFEKNEIDEICKIGEKRYSDKVPPGYMDCKSKNGIEIYGDLIIWREILKKSKTENKHIILVTGDVKEDWFLRSNGKTLGPRPELIHEFREETNQLFYAYPTNQFLEFANQYIGTNIEKEVIEEVENVLITEEKRTKTSNTIQKTTKENNSTLSNHSFGETNKTSNNSSIQQSN